MLVIVAIAKLKYNGKRKASANLKEYKAIKEAEKLWEHCLEEEQNIWELEAKNRGFRAYPHSHSIVDMTQTPRNTRVSEVLITSVW